MRVLVTGANGFIGRALVNALLRQGQLASPTGKNEPISRLVLADLNKPDSPTNGWQTGSIPVTHLAGDIADPAFITSLVRHKPQAVFHLAASLTLQAEEDPDTAFKVNVQPVRELVARLEPESRFLFASSIAVFGGELPSVVSDDQRPAPATTYGTHKAIVELLLADAARKGLVDARSLRLPIILIRQGSGSGSVSDQVAAIVREPLAGKDVLCGLHPETRMPVASASAVAKALIRLHNLPAHSLPPGRVMNLPSLTVTPQQMVDALQRTRLQGVKGTVRFQPNDTLQAIVNSWPREFVSETATGLGLAADSSFDEIINDYLAESGT